MSFKEDAKQWFETGDYPTQAQFAQVFDWLRWKDEQQAISTIIGLQDILNDLAPNTPETFTKSSGAGVSFNYTAPQNFLLEKIILIPSSNSTSSLYIDGVISIEDDAILTTKGTVWTLELIALTDRAVNITGLPAGSKIIIIKRKII